MRVGVEGRGVFTKVLQCLFPWTSMGDRGTPGIAVCNTASPTPNAISPVFLSSTPRSYLPLAFSLFYFDFVVFFLYWNLYLLFRLLLNLSVISKRKKNWQKKHQVS